MPDGAVVDTSVIAAMLLREPGWQAIATRLSRLGTVRVAPFFRFECGNVLGKRRLDRAEAEAALALVWSLPVTDSFEVEDAQDALQIARAHGLPFYDAAFIALAKRTGLPLWSLDRAQRGAAEAEAVRVA